jgi:hypothetical protein
VSPPAAAGVVSVATAAVVSVAAAVVSVDVVSAGVVSAGVDSAGVVSAATDSGAAAAVVSVEELELLPHAARMAAAIPEPPNARKRRRLTSALGGRLGRLRLVGSEGAVTGAPCVVVEGLRVKWSIGR